MGNSLSLNKFETTQNNDPNDLTKNLLNQTAGQVEAKPPTIHENNEIDDKNLPADAALNVC